MRFLTLAASTLALVALGACAQTGSTQGKPAANASGVPNAASLTGVAKTTLYRHFGTKAALVVTAASSCFVELPTPDTGDLETDLRLVFDAWKATDE